MRVLLDECVPRKLREELAGHEVRTVPEMGWAGLSDRRLLRRAEAEFDVFLTVDGGLRFQQNLSRCAMAVVLLRARSNEIEHLRPLMPGVRRAIPSLGSGQVFTVGE